jgi:hypothetical protein
VAEAPKVRWHDLCHTMATRRLVEHATRKHPTHCQACGSRIEPHRQGLTDFCASCVWRMREEDRAQTRRARKVPA